MNVSLTPQLGRFVKKKIDEGHFKNASDVVAGALRGLMERDRMRHRIASGLGPWLSGPKGRGINDMGAGSGIQSLVYTVLAQAVRDADKDMELIMAEVKAATSAKQALRDIVNLVGRDVAANAGQTDGVPPLDLSGGMGSAAAYNPFQMPVAAPQSSGGLVYVSVNLVGGTAPVATVCQLKAIQQTIQDDLDSMNEMSEMTSIRLQMAMDRRSKLIATLSNIMKSFSDAGEAVVQNMK
jgi:putative addiction module CopG family antidote